MTRMFLYAMSALLLATGGVAAQTCGSLPYTFSAGTVAEASKVNENFSYIVNCFAKLSANTFTGAQTLPGNPTSNLQAATKQYVDAGSGGGGGFVNKLRNGTFVSWPKGTSGTATTAPTGSAAISANGWAIIPVGASVAWQQTTPGGNGAPLALQVTGATSVTGVAIGQRIESSDTAPLKGQTVTFQMAVYNATGAAITPTLTTRYPSAADNWGTSTVDVNGVNLQSCANGAWTTVSYSFTPASGVSNGYEIRVDFGNNFSTGSKNVQISAADLRASATVQTPELPNIAAEMIRNARYYQASYDNGTTPGTGNRSLQNLGNNGTGTTNAIGFQFPVRMRSAPTMAFWDGAGNSGKASKYQGGTWSDNIGTLATLSIGTTGLVMTSTDGTGIINWAHYTAYADFW